MPEDKNTDLAEKIKKIAGERNVFENEPMAGHLTMRVGGCADFFVTPENEENLVSIINLLRDSCAPYYVLGRGSNVIVKDEGYRGFIVNISGKMSDIRIEGNKVFARAGARLRDISDAAAAASLSGFEFAAGIPGSLGGAVAMNAGAYDGEIKDVVRKVRLLTPGGSIVEVSGDDMNFSYRHSRVFDDNLTVLSAVLELSSGNEDEIRKKISDFASKRKEKQPLEFSSCGSTFKRPEGYFAGKLIMDSGLKGFMIGGAQVSEKHCGFIINRNCAKAADIISLIEHVKQTVLEKQGVELECEVKIL